MHDERCDTCWENHERYTLGECWLLAYALNQYGLPVYTLGPEPGAWWHVVVQVGADSYLDIEGLTTSDALACEWPDPLSEQPGAYDGELFPVTWERGGRLLTVFTDDFATYCEAVEYRYKGGKRHLAADLKRADEVARHLLGAYAPHVLQLQLLAYDHDLINR